MSHPRTIIRKHAADLLRGAGFNVYTSRYHTLAQMQLPCVIVSTDEGEESERSDTSGGLQRELALTFSALARATNGPTLEDDLDGIADELESVIDKQAFGGALSSLTLIGTDFEGAPDENDSAFGMIALNYRAIYFTQQD